MSVPTPGGSSGPRPAGYLAWSRSVVLVALILLTLGAWAITVEQARTMDMPMGVVAGGSAGTMGGMGMGDMAASGMAAADWSFAAAATFLAAWSVMMVAMMLPATAPMLLLFTTVQARRRGQATFVPTWVFAAGYLLVWVAIGGLVYALVQFVSDLAGRLGASERETWAPVALGLTLVLAGLYQFTPLKRVCLRHCRSPFGFLAAHWREGYVGALRMGVWHGAYCVGCCWALFAVLVAAGVMSLAWMLLLTLVVFAEKVVPHGRRTAGVVGLLLVVLGVLVAAGATGLPWAA